MLSWNCYRVGGLKWQYIAIIATFSSYDYNPVAVIIKAYNDNHNHNPNGRQPLVKSKSKAKQRSFLRRRMIASKLNAEYFEVRMPHCSSHVPIWLLPHRVAYVENYILQCYHSSILYSKIKKSSLQFLVAKSYCVKPRRLTIMSVFSGQFVVCRAPFSQIQLDYLA